MIFLRTRFFVIFILLIVILFLVGAVLGYISLTGSGDKTGAEQLLLYGIVAVAAIVFFFLRVLVYGRRAVRKFDKILEAAKLHGQLPLDRLDYFGGFGKNMRRLYEELHTLGERKSKRIQEQNLTINRLLEFITVPLAVVDSTGQIRKASGGFAEKYKIPAANVSGKALREYLENCDFQEILTTANKTKKKVEAASGKTTVTFYPVLSTANNVSYFITVFGTHELRTYMPKDTDGTPTALRPEKKRFMGGLIERIRRKLMPKKHRKDDQTSS